MESFIINLPHTCVYVEHKNIMIFGTISICKLKTCKSGSIKIQKEVKECMVGHFFKIRIVGRGYKLLTHLHIAMLKVGYAHPIFITSELPVAGIPKEKKKRFYTFFSSRKNLIYKHQIIFPFLRKIDIYSKKGIYIQNQMITFKEGKKAFSF